MIRRTSVFSSLAATLLVACAHSPATVSSGIDTYPEALRTDVIDDYHGTMVADPYRWLEDPDSPQTRTWIDGQNALTRSWLDEVDAHDTIRARLEQLWDYERFGIPFEEGDRYFYFHNAGLQDQSVLYMTDSLEGQPRIALDPNTLSEDGTIALGDLAVSEDGRFLAYGVSDGGSDWNTWHVRDLETGEDLEDTLDWTKFTSAAWTHDHQGFFYSRYPTPENPLEQVNHFNKLYYHRLGTLQSEDTLIYENPDEPEWGFGSQVTDDGRYLLISIWQSTENKNRVYVKDLSDSSSAVVQLLDDYDASYHFLGNIDSRFWFQTNLDASRERIILVDLDEPDRDKWQEIVPEGTDTLQNASMVGERLVVEYLHDAHSQVRMFELDGTPAGDVDLPGLGSASGFHGQLGDSETFFGFTSFTSPRTIYRF
ncbi:MAG: S9 family peptidase, partial [Myxococcota bacterium]|nr:S9 family peptidase [Myxococcota bacterium]